MLKLLKPLFFKEYVMSESEKLINDIIIKLLEKDETEAVTAPISQTYYISNEELQYYVRIDEFNVGITNHKFSFNQPITPKFSNILISMVQNHMEINRKAFEERVFNNQIELLRNIKNTL
jgi:hypothetical protein